MTILTEFDEHNLSIPSTMLTFSTGITKEVSHIITERCIRHEQTFINSCIFSESKSDNSKIQGVSLKGFS